MLTRRHWVAAAISIPVLVLAGPTVANEPVKVVASFSILADLLQNVGGERISITTLVGPDGDAHVFQPTPADAKAMKEASLVVMNGIGFEGWMKRLIKSSGTKAQVIEAASKVTPRGIKEEGEGHDHDHGHDHGELDPHAWQDVANVKLYVAAIGEALGAADPAGKAVYDANAAAYIAKLSVLDSEVKAAIAQIPVERRKIITSHDAFGYLAAAYGLEFVAPQGVSTETEVSAKGVARIIRQIKKQKIAAVFMENISDERLIRRIADETGVAIGGTLFSDALSDDKGPAATYIDMMKHNLAQMTKALAA
jgi:zinc/manganese transport system substrate-binding protein